MRPVGTNKQTNITGGDTLQTFILEGMTLIPWRDTLLYMFCLISMLINKLKLYHGKSLLTYRTSCLEGNRVFVDSAIRPDKPHTVPWRTGVN